MLAIRTNHALLYHGGTIDEPPVRYICLPQPSRTSTTSGTTTRVTSDDAPAWKHAEIDRIWDKSHAKQVRRSNL